MSKPLRHRHQNRYSVRVLPSTKSCELVLVFTCYLSGARGHDDIERCWEAITAVLMTRPSTAQQPDQRIFSSSLWLDAGPWVWEWEGFKKCSMLVVSASQPGQPVEISPLETGNTNWSHPTSGNLPRASSAFICHHKQNLQTNILWFY